ncbi:hypothetical protein OAS39_07445 [Pirellulales bacterium]|nr:hypothetical protein [Pirellulales bacterium]
MAIAQAPSLRDDEGRGMRPDDRVGPLPVIKDALPPTLQAEPDRGLHGGCVPSAPLLGAGGDNLVLLPY